MDDLGSAASGKFPADGGGIEAGNPVQLRGRESADAAGELMSAGIRELDDGLSGKISFYTGDSFGEEAGAAVAERLHRPVIKEEASLRTLEKGNPALPCREGGFRGNKKRSFGGAGADGGKDVRCAGGTDEDPAAGANGEVGRFQLGDHATGGVGVAGISRHLADFPGDFRDDRDSFTLALVAEESGNCGENDEEVRLEEARDKGAEDVIVPEFDFIRAHGVVFIHDRDGSQLEQPLKGVADGKMTASPADVLPREEDLRGGESVGLKTTAPDFDKAGLSHSGTGLETGKVIWAVMLAEKSQPHPDGAGGNEDHLHPGGSDEGDLPTEIGEP